MQAHKTFVQWTLLHKNSWCKNQSLAPLLTRKLDGADLVPLIGDDLHALRACDKQKAPGNIHTH